MQNEEYKEAKKNYLKKNKYRYRNYIVTALITYSIFVGVVISMSISMNMYTKGTEKVTAYIEDAKNYYDEGSFLSANSTVLVLSYNVDENTYKTETECSTSLYKKGSYITVRYKKGDPEHIKPLQTFLSYNIAACSLLIVASCSIILLLFDYTTSIAAFKELYEETHNEKDQAKN